MMIILVGGPRMSWGRVYNCRPKDKTFSIDIPEMKPDKSGSWFVRYLYKVREIEGYDFLVGDFDYEGWR